MLKESKITFNRIELFANGDKQKIICTQGGLQNIISLDREELFVTNEDLQKLKLTDITLFRPSVFSDTVMGAAYQTPLFCKHIRDYEKEILLQKTPLQINECIDDMKTLYTMFPDCANTAKILNRNISVMNAMSKEMRHR